MAESTTTTGPAAVDTSSPPPTLVTAAGFTSTEVDDGFDENDSAYGDEQ